MLSGLRGVRPFQRFMTATFYENGKLPHQCPFPRRQFLMADGSRGIIKDGTCCGYRGGGAYPTAAAQLALKLIDCRSSNLRRQWPVIRHQQRGVQRRQRFQIVL